MNVLWLASWYPSKSDPFAGDFIQRHAIATSAIHNIYVLHVSKVSGYPAGTFPSHEMRTGDNLTEHIIYNKATHLPILGNLYSLINYFLIHRKFINEYIVRYGKPSIVHVHVPVKSGLIALWLKWKYRIPFVVTEHYDIYNDIVPERFEKRSFLFRFLTRRIIKLSSALLPVSSQLGDSINMRVCRKPYTVIENVVDTSVYKFHVPPSGRFRFIHVSNLVPRKNVSAIIEAIFNLVLQNVDVELLIVGGEQHIIDQYKNHPAVQRSIVHFTGEVSYEEVAKQIISANAMVLFSYSENLPCVVLESLCCGRPVISTRVGGIPEVITSKNGILIEINTLLLMETMRMMMANYSRYDLRAIAKEASELYAYNKIGRKISDVYSSLRS